MRAAPHTFVLAPAPGESIVVDRLPGSAPHYVFLHGLGSVRVGEKSTSLFDHAARRGRGGLRFDFRGHGASTGRIGYTTVSEFVDDTCAVLDHLAEPAVLVGSSVGGMVAAFAASRRPQQVVGLVLLAPAFGFLHRMERRVDAEGRLHTAEGRAFPVHARVLADAASLDETALPARLPMAVLLVHGDADELLPVQLSERFHAAIPHTRKDLWIVPGGDHRLNKEAAVIWQRMDRLLG